MSTTDERLDELVGELDADAAADELGPEFVSGIVSTARWQAPIRDALGSVLRLVDAVGIALKKALGARQ